MQAKASGMRSPALVMLGLFIVLAGIFAYYYVDSSGNVASLQSQVASLGSDSESLASVVASQSQAMQSTGAQAGTVTVTTTSVSTTTLGGVGPVSTTTSISTETVTKSTVITSTVTTGGANVASVAGTLQPATGVNVTGILTVSVTNEGYDPITGVSVVIPTGSDPSSDLCTSSCPLQVTYNSAAVSPSSPLPGGQTASGSAQTSEGQPNTTYTVTFVLSFGDGSQQSFALQVSD
jgi:hypothetical protein